jgi:arylsulfatase A-like enzyme
LKTYAAMMKSLDDGIGEVLRAVDRAGMTRNTLVIFTSDNGGERFSYNWPFRGQKFSLWEGGIRVPAMVRWPGVVPVGNVTQQAAITMDWTQTMLSAGNAKAEPEYPLDGNDLLPVIRGVQPNYERTLYWRTSVQDAALKGHWKYLKDGTEEYLFDLSVDEREQANFRELNPGMFARLRDEFKQWNSTVLPRPAPRQR